MDWEKRKKVLSATRKEDMRPEKETFDYPESQARNKKGRCEKTGQGTIVGTGQAH